MAVWWAWQQHNWCRLLACHMCLCVCLICWLGSCLGPIKRWLTVDQLWDLTPPKIQTFCWVTSSTWDTRCGVGQHLIMISCVSKNTAVKDQRLKSEFLNMSHLVERWCRSISEPVDRCCKSVYGYLITCCVLHHMRQSMGNWGSRLVTVIVFFFLFLTSLVVWSKWMRVTFCMSSVHSSKRCKI